MVNSKLIHTLRTFEKPELKRLHHFVNSPFFNSNEPPKKLLEEIEKFHPYYTHNKLTYEYLHERLYPGKPFNLSTMKNIFSDLLSLVERFLAEITFENETGKIYECLLRQLTDRKLATMFEVQLGWADKDYFEAEGADSFYFLDRYRFELGKYNFVLTNGKILKKKELNNETGHLVKAFVNLVNFFVMEITTIYLNLQSYAGDYNIENIKETIKEFINNFEIDKAGSTFGDFNEHRFIFELYTALLETYEDFANERKYFAYKEIFNKYADRLSPDEISFHLYRMVDYCIIKINKGGSERDFNGELSAIYNMMLENRYYLDRKFSSMHYDLFRAILLHGISMKNLVWTQNFIDKYSDEVHPKLRTDMYNLGYAYLNFASGNFEEALKNVNKIPHDYFILKYDSKNLLLRIHSELQNNSTALDLILSYKQTLSRDKMMSAERKKRYMKFVRYLEKLLLKKEGKKRIDAGFYLRELRKETDISFKEWLVEKYETYLGIVKKTG